MALKVLLVAIAGFAVVAVVLGFLRNDTRAETDTTTAGGSGQSTVLTAPGDEERRGSGVLVPLVSNQGCDYYRGFYALRQSNANTATARNQNSNTNRQSQSSEAQSTSRSTSRVVINGVVVHDETVESNSSGGSQSTSTSVSVSSSDSGSHTKVTVNGTVVVDKTTGTTALSAPSGLLNLLLSALTQRLQFETMVLLNWNIAAVAGPACADDTP